MSDFILNASVRNDLGKGASRRLRRANEQVPAIIYGGEKEPQPISVEKAAFYKAIEEEVFFSSIINLVVDGKSEQVVVRDLQRHPFKPLITHADFLRVAANQEFTTRVPLHLAGEEACVGIKDQDGELHQLASDVEISCLPKDLPDYLEFDISDLEVGAIKHLSDLSLPAGVTIPALALGEDHDGPILSIVKAKVRSAGDDAEDAEGGEEGEQGEE
ncbi:MULTISPECIES: 50S ribosomal protein L25/general stress protein Ctc [Halomonas]|uniref:Large ribosomal subunit protein bL25 n=1 Tax=Halomonas icarae TaxID=2691040 RepID=A0A7X4VWT7_9GAMM|nr:MULTISPECIES: 50S ribosomal protein L25/general stress protein Ctc [Halomonas]MBF7054545.1 50S ribosomal protein L25/general stress protein Ctc [Halomonas sp. KAO]MDR5901470.1 50S ribosomal protein L25/general stress protein Ctc [Halomonas icarae]MDT0500258.1 50S ribosomal protein L25/general stress protein Ctc [Halomonas sp. PAR7]MDT0511247.1 50S ribosomal protein L25/general stress protein Ctc [Halomonas sp. LES1]MDT0590464.1 50S ribosomal protein L25/general stress protein Ctc [Halomonas